MEAPYRIEITKEGRFKIVSPHFVVKAHFDNLVEADEVAKEYYKNHKGDSND